MFALLLAVAMQQPAEAEEPVPVPVVELDWIEVNEYRPEVGTTVQQVVFWRVRYDRQMRQWRTIDCGWAGQAKAVLIETEDGWEVLANGRRYVAPNIYWSVTDFDPEFTYRTEYMRP